MSKETDQILRSAWDEISNGYQERYEIGTSRIHYGPLCPSEDELQLLGDLNGKDVLEIGAGAGQNSIVAAKLGALAVAVDISEVQISHGRKLAQQENVDVEFKVSSFMDFCEIGYDEDFDTALSVYALQYCHDIDEMHTVFNGINKALRPGGRFVMSLDHPLRAHGYWEEDKFITDNYFDRGTKTWKYKFPEKNIEPMMTGSFKTVSDYFSALIETGFEVRKLLEPEPIPHDPNSNFGVLSQYGTCSTNDPYNYGNLQRIPGTIIFQSFKPIEL